MPCTYYGGSTSRFTRNVLQGLEQSGRTVGAYQSFKFTKESPKVRGFDSLLFADNDKVLSNILGGASPLFTPLEIPEGTGPEEARSIVNLDFLVQCKLLDLKKYTATCSEHPSPIALQSALEAAKKVTKPDFPRKRSYGSDTADFFEALIYCPLVPEEPPFMFEQAYRFGNFGIWSQYCMKGPKALQGVKDELVVRTSFTLDSFVQVRGEMLGELRVHGWPTLSLQNMERLGFLDIAVFNTLSTLYPRVEALQQAVRTKLHYYTQSPTDAVELPIDFNAEY